LAVPLPARELISWSPLRYNRRRIHQNFLPRDPENSYPSEHFQMYIQAFQVDCPPSPCRAGSRSWQLKVAGKSLMPWMD